MITSLKIIVNIDGIKYNIDMIMEETGFYLDQSFTE